MLEKTIVILSIIAVSFTLLAILIIPYLVFAKDSVITATVEKNEINHCYQVLKDSGYIN